MVDRIAKELAAFRKELESAKDPAEVDLLRKKVAQWTAWDSDKTVKAEDFGYEAKSLSNNRVDQLWKNWFVGDCGPEQAAV